MSDLARLLERSGLSPDDQCAPCLTEADARGLLDLAGPGVTGLGLRALVYLYLAETPPASGLALGASGRLTRRSVT